MCKTTQATVLRVYIYLNNTRSQVTVWDTNLIRLLLYLIYI